MKKQLTCLMMILTVAAFGQVKQKLDFSTFLPEGYILFEQISGDLNKDGIEDHVLIIKKVDTTQIVTDEYLGDLDRNRRGIIVLFGNKDHYELVVENLDCFSSENEEQGLYIQPELYLEIKRGNLYVNYLYGKSGYLKYTFRYKNSDFELIGFDVLQASHAVIKRETSINFSTKKIKDKINIKEDAQIGEEVFKEEWKELKINKLIKLAEIKDFDELGLSVFLN